MKTNINPVGRQNDLILQDLTGELLIYDLLANKAFCLNETSAAIWNLCDGGKSVSDISQELSRKFKTPVSEDFVGLAIDQLKKANLFENSRKIKTNLEGVSRREVIRRVGFGAMIALPIVSSLVAPTAVSAQSICGCVNPGQCITQTTCPSQVNCNPMGQCAP